MVIPAAQVKAQLLTHQGVAAIGRHQQARLEFSFFPAEAGQVFAADTLQPACQQVTMATVTMVMRIHLGQCVSR